MIRVLIVEDSPVVREFLVHILKADPDIQVVGTAHDGEEALEAVQRSRPDVITMDVHMPRMDGLEATHRIMETQPTPIVIVSGSADPREVATTFRAIEAGALAVLPRPRGIGHPAHEATARELVQTVKLMSEVKVVRRWPRSRSTPPPVVRPVEWTHAPAEVKFIGIGASTGGPPVLQTVLASLPKDFSVPILIVQHIAHGFLPGLAEWLNQTTGFRVQVASYGTCPLPGHVYLAPDDFHMGIGASGRILLTKEEPENGLRPAVSFLFRSLAEVCGPNALGVLLSGMGKDGAAELKLMKDKGAITIAQDRESSVVHGMPGEAIALGGATHVLPADKIPDGLVTLVNRANST